MKQVFQLQATGVESLCGSGLRTIYNTGVFATYALAEQRKERFRDAVKDRIDNPDVRIVAMDVVEEDDCIKLSS